MTGASVAAVAGCVVVGSAAVATAAVAAATAAAADAVDGTPVGVVLTSGRPGTGMSRR